MSTHDFSTEESLQQLALEVSCLKALFTQMLKAIGQADAGKIINKMEKAVADLEDTAQAEAFTRTLMQVKQAYRQ